MRLAWLENGFVSKELYSPFVIERDDEYLPNLTGRFDHVLEQAQKVGADGASLGIISKYKEGILRAVRSYYKADIAECNEIIKALIEDIGSDSFAVAGVNESKAFPGPVDQELQFFRSRVGSPACSYEVKDMLHLPKSSRSKTGNYRFSIPGNPSLYLSNSSYGCWIETGFPPEIDFNVSPVLLDGTQKIFNLAVYVRDFSGLNDLEEHRVHCWLKLLMLMIATSYRVNEAGRTFKSEYIVSQAVMMACKKLGYDGVAYRSRRVSEDSFAYCAINLALFVDYGDGEYSDLVEHMKMDEPFNYALFKQLAQSLKYKGYDLRCVNHAFATNIGSFSRQHPYAETVFFEFDKYLYAMWRDKPNGKGKDLVPWGVTTE